MVNLNRLWPYYFPICRARNALTKLLLWNLWQPVNESQISYTNVITCGNGTRLSHDTILQKEHKAQLEVHVISRAYKGNCQVQLRGSIGKAATPRAAINDGVCLGHCSGRAERGRGSPRPQRRAVALD